MSKKNEKTTNLNDMTQEELLAYAASLEKKNAALAGEKDSLKKELTKPKNEEASNSSINEWLEEKVPFQAFKDADAYKDDIVVKINGERWQIPRGKLHMIPRKVWLVLSDSERQNNLAADVQTGYENEFETNVKGRM